MTWAARDLREQLGLDVPDGVTATQTEDDRARPVLHLSDGRVARVNPAWPYEPSAERWLLEVGCSAQGCACTPSAPCDATLCDGEQRDDGATVLCTMCLGEMVDELTFLPSEHEEHDCWTVGCR